MKAQTNGGVCGNKRRFCRKGPFAGNYALGLKTQKAPPAVGEDLLASPQRVGYFDDPALRGVLAGHPIQGSRAAGLAALSIAISRLYRAALMTVSAPAAHFQTNVTMSSVG